MFLRSVGISLLLLFVLSTQSPSPVAVDDAVVMERSARHGLMRWNAGDVDTRMIRLLMTERTGKKWCYCNECRGTELLPRATCYYHYGRHGLYQDCREWFGHLMEEVESDSDTGDDDDNPFVFGGENPVYDSGIFGRCGVLYPNSVESLWGGVFYHPHTIRR